MQYRSGINFMVIAPSEATSFAWAGLLRDHEISLRSTWHADVTSAMAALVATPTDVIALLGAPTPELLEHCRQQRTLLVVFHNGNAHQGASWLAQGAEAVMPANQLATLVPIVTRGLERNQLLDKARKSKAQLQANDEAYLNALEHLGIAVAKVAEGKILWANNPWAQPLRCSPESLVGQLLSEHLAIDNDLTDLSTDHTHWVELANGQKIGLKAAQHYGQECAMVMRSLPSSTSGFEPAATGSFGIQTCINSLTEQIERGTKLSLVVVDLKRANLLRQELSLLDYTHLMAGLQAKLAVGFNAPPEPITDTCFLIPLQADGHSAVELSRACLDSVANEVIVDGLPMVVAGAGVLETTPQDDDPAALIQKVYDLAVETAENDVRLHRATTAEMVLKDPVMALRSALDNQQCELRFQPAIALNAIEGELYEVLSQMRDEQGNAVPARMFIRDAARRDLGQIFDHYVIEHALQALLQHLPMNPKTQLIINLTLSSLQSKDLVHQIQGLTLSVSDKSRIIFQFRETDIVLDQQTSQIHISSLLALGFGVSCAQFGNLPNPERLLDQIPFNWVKLDPSWIEGIKADPEKQSALKAMVSKIHERNMVAIAPMVEQPSILSALYKSGVDLIQGHLMSPPRPQMDYQFEEEI